MALAQNKTAKSRMSAEAMCRLSWRERLEIPRAPDWYNMCGMMVSIGKGNFMEPFSDSHAFMTLFYAMAMHHRPCCRAPDLVFLVLCLI